MEQVIDLIVNNGVALAVVMYFLWKDSTLTKENTEILQQVKSLLEVLTNERGGVDET